LSPVLGNGRYELLEFVSKGGMGAIYRARDVELERQVAVKCLLDVSKEDARRLAVKEARTLASLNHPNIMRVFDIIPHGEQIWIVAEWLEGKSLGQYPLPLPPGVVLGVMAQVYDALTAAHSANVFHRDVKPGNVMIGPDGRVTLIDFGVAFAPGASTGATLAGSLRYTDPRILEGQPPDARADLFSAALLQIELMTGETVLPDLAPIPLYRHAKKGLRQRLDVLLDGSYPPLAALARRATERFPETYVPDVVGDLARAAALTAHEALRALTPEPPAAYLAKTLCAGEGDDAIVANTVRAEAAQRLAETDLSPRVRAAWMAFDTRMADPGVRPAFPTPPAPKAPARARTSERHTAVTALLAVMVLLLGGTVAWMLMRGDEVLPETTAVVVAPEAPAVAPPVPVDGTNEVVAKAVENALAEPVPTPAPKPAAKAPEFVPLHLTADAWARVLVDGIEAGKLPQAAPFLLAPGRHKLRLENPSTQAVTTEILIEPGAPQRLHFHLIPKQVRRLVKLKAPGRLYIDGVDHGVVTSKKLSLSYGTHAFRVERNGRTVRELSVALGPDTPGTVALE